MQNLLTRRQISDILIKDRRSNNKNTERGKRVMKKSLMRYLSMNDNDFLDHVLKSTNWNLIIIRHNIYAF
jgi:hypothetical protein